MKSIIGKAVGNWSFLKKAVLTIVQSRTFRLIFGFMVSAVSIYLIFRNVNLEDVKNTLMRSNMIFIGLSLISVAVNIISKAIRWRLIMGRSNQHVSLLKTTGAVLIGQMLNNLIPARIGEISRAHIIGRLGPGRMFILGTIAIEKVIDMLFYTLLFIVLLLLMPLPSWLTSPAYLFVVITIVMLLFILLLSYYQDISIGVLAKFTVWLPQKIRVFLVNHVDKGVSSLNILQDHVNNVKIAFMSGMIWGTAVATNYLLLLALQINVPVIASVFVLVVLQAGISVPSVPGRIGFFEYLCVLSLGVFSVEQVLGLSYGILLHAVVFLPTTIAGILFFLGSDLRIHYTNGIAKTIN